MDNWGDNILYYAIYKGFENDVHDFYNASDTANCSAYYRPVEYTSDPANDFGDEDLDLWFRNQCGPGGRPARPPEGAQWDQA